MKNKHFETGIVKILDGKENELSLTEILQCKRLKKHEDDEENQTPVIVESDFAEEILQKRQKKGDESKYLNCRFLFPTSNILERFFSAAGYALNDLRQNITPEHLEQQLFLRANKKYWTVKTVNSVLSDWYRFVIVFFRLIFVFISYCFMWLNYCNYWYQLLIGKYFHQLLIETFFIPNYFPIFYCQALMLV